MQRYSFKHAIPVRSNAVLEGGGVTKAHPRLNFLLINLDHKNR